MKWVFAVVLLAALAVPVPAEPRETKPARQTPAARSSAKASSPAHKPAASVRGHRRSRTRRAAHAGPAYQQHPDATRYAEIQKALADRGYFKGEPNGKWGDDSVDALKRFQADQKLDTDGKINSRTLIGLGLGPKHEGSLTPSTPALPPPGPAEHTEPLPATPPI